MKCIKTAVMVAVVVASVFSTEVVETVERAPQGSGSYTSEEMKFERVSVEKWAIYYGYNVRGRKVWKNGVYIGTVNRSERSVKTTTGYIRIMMPVR